MARREVLPEFIAIRVPTRDRRGRILPDRRRQQWIQRLKRFLLNDLGIIGMEKDQVEGLWRGEYDLAADSFQVVTEGCLIIRCYCSMEQLKTFTERGEELLVEMGMALDQDAMAYETREGLIILYTTARE
ncbi:MAG: hypothetical protein FJX76_05060 [Armatimonadetes bacterium]|nr:hypothetical protein [Armatimonadota bacterium]